MKELKVHWRWGAFPFAIVREKHPEKKENKNIAGELAGRILHVFFSNSLRRQIEPGVFEEVDGLDLPSRKGPPEFRGF